MRDINELIARLKIETNKEDREEAFAGVMEEIQKYYTENLFLNQYEVAIFLTNAEISFSCPAFV